MRDIPFQDGGALLANSPVYIERDADRRAQNHLRRMEYITLVEPRQQGKTSLINRLTARFQPQGYVFAYVDLTTLDKAAEAAWYQSIGDWLLQWHLDFIPRDNWPALPTNGNTWRNFLANLSKAAATVPCNLVLALDEVGAVPEAWATGFFSAIRSVYNSRQSIPVFRHLTFVVAGAYNPKELIKDPTISNFNVDHRIPLPDFDLSEIVQLVAHLPGGVDIPVVARRLHHWTGGQPYLCQRLCCYLAEQNNPITPKAVDAAVERFFQEDTNHLSRIQLHLDDERELLEYARKIVTERSKFSPSVNDWQFRLAHIVGVISANEEGRCHIRNGIYERAFPQLSQSIALELHPPRPVVRLKLQLTRRRDLRFEVRVLGSPMGETGAIESELPYTEDELIAILKALRTPKYAASDFTPAQRETLERLGLLHEFHFVSDLPERVGWALYGALMIEAVDRAFQMALNQMRPIKGVVALELRLDRDAVELAQYPWELLYHEQSLLLGGIVELTRYISYPQAVTPLTVSPPLRLLYVESRPTNLSRLDRNEQTIVRQALADLEAEGLIQVDELAQPTYDALLDHLETQPTHILHIDGHGVFARQCPECGAMNYPRHTHCQAEHGCHQSLTGAKPYGYLAFEDEQTRHVKWMRSNTVGNLLSRRSVRLAVLSACRSGSVGGEVLFSGTAPALIQAGVPAVVSTQLPISASAAAKFMRGFYHALARFESLPAAVNAGRLRVPEREWFIPTLYLRSQDDEGHLFIQPQGG